MTKPPLNQILYGPPGTGKTYHTIEAAVRAVNPLASWSDRTDLKAQYDALVRAGQIRFVTFHQSFGYEEFVEGLRARNDEQGQVRYEVEAGVFKTLCDSASSHATRREVQGGFSLEGRGLWKMSLGNTAYEEGRQVFEDCLENDYVLLGYGDEIDFSGCRTRQQVKDAYLSAEYEVSDRDYALTSVDLFINRLKKGDLIVVSDGNFKYRAVAEVTGDYEFIDKEDWDSFRQKRGVKWLVTFDTSRPVDELLFAKSLSQQTLYQLKDSVIDRARLAAIIQPESSPVVGPENYVLIIDEINRGNISKIFGELITLIEPSKRAGQPEALSLKLPYSQESFSVPANLHIIGTMNTADRSLALMDTALRRRFDFVEMMPDYGCLQEVEVAGINLAAMLKLLNQRIECLYDREHTLGHAFFIPVKEAAQSERMAVLASVMQHKILPLLEEYFFEDWEKIRLVLGDNQKPETLQFLHARTTDLHQLFGGDLDGNGQEMVRYQLNPAAFLMPEAYPAFGSGLAAEI